MRRIVMGVLHRMGLLEAGRDFFNFLRYWLLADVRRDNEVFLRTGVPDNLPLPSPWLIHMVSGSFSLPGFYRNGEHGAACIRRILKKNGIEMEHLRSILDFGCGCGRVVRFWAGLPRTKVSGTDYNPRLAGWCRDNLKFGEFAVNGLSGRLGYPDGAFDFVYAISVFTHLTAELQRAWLDELLRVSAPGGFLYITVLGTQHRRMMSDAEWETFLRGGMIEQWEGYPGTNICRAFHPESYFRGELVGKARGSRVGVVDFIPGGAEDADHQDVFLLKKL